MKEEDASFSFALNKVRGPGLLILKSVHKRRNHVQCTLWNLQALYDIWVWGVFDNIVDVDVVCSRSARVLAYRSEGRPLTPLPTLEKKPCQSS